VNSAATSDAALQQALALHREGKLALAMERYIQILQGDPENGDALYYVAVVAAQEGHFGDSLRLAERALKLGSEPARIHNLVGQTHLRLNQPTQALAGFQRAIEANPDFAQAHGNRASLLSDLGRYQEALAGFDRALGLNPQSAEDWTNRGAVLDELKRGDEALASYERALALQPNLAGAHFNLAGALRDRGLLERALASYDRAIELNPKFADAYAHSGPALRELGRLDEAIARLDRAIELAPRDATALASRGQCRREAGRLEDSEADYSRALESDPKSANAQLGRGLTRLARGDWDNGFADYEARAGVPSPAYAPLPYPRWKGEPLPSARLVLLAEQGLGDAIQFCRFAPLLASRGFDVTIMTQPSMRALLATLTDVSVVTSHDELAADRRPIRWLPLMSIPGVLRIQPNTVPAAVPYLAAQPERATAWSDRLGAQGFRIGINWASGPSLEWYRRKRDIPLAAFAPLAALPGVRLISLQMGAARSQIAQAPFARTIETLGDEFDSAATGAFLDSAAVMMNLDLVVTCDTSIAHLAGALARPAFVALPLAPDWRFLTDREDSPWYPTMRLFRQTQQSRWDDVMTRIAEAAAAMAAR